MEGNIMAYATPQTRLRKTIISQREEATLPAKWTLHRRVLREVPPSATGSSQVGFTLCSSFWGLTFLVDVTTFDFSPDYLAEN